MNKQTVINYLQNMREMVPEQPLKETLWQTNRAYLKTRFICEEVGRPDRIIIAGTRFELPLDLISTTDYDHILLNLIENEFESQVDWKIVNNTHLLINQNFRIRKHDEDWVAIRLNYDYDALKEFVKFIYFINNNFEIDPVWEERFYHLVISTDHYLPELRSTYIFEDLKIRFRFYSKHAGTLIIKFDEDRDKYLEPLIRLNMLRGAY